MKNAAIIILGVAALVLMAQCERLWAQLYAARAHISSMTQQLADKTLGDCEP